MNHNDILWVEDFPAPEKYIDPLEDDEESNDDIPDNENYQKELKDYFPKPYQFRVNIYKYFLKLLLHLEKHFSKYNCAVLDINLANGFNWIGDSESDEYYRPKNDQEEMDEVIDKLNKYNVILRILKDKISENGISDEEAYKKGYYDQIRINAGYYLYLYLLQRGMPSERICMLTGNKGGENSNNTNTSSEWDLLFQQSGLNPPKSFEKNAEKEEFKKWLNNIFTLEYSFRSCIIAMIGCLLDLIETGNIKLRNIWDNKWKDEEKDVGIEDVKHILENVKKIPLRISEEDMESYGYNIIWQLVSPWGDITNDNITDIDEKPFYYLLKYTRNWLAHRLIKNLDIISSSFLIGLSLRGLFDFDDNRLVENGKYKEFVVWEGRLLNLIGDIDKEVVLENDVKKFDWITLKSCAGIKFRFDKIRNENDEYNEVTYQKLTENISVETDKICKMIYCLGKSSANINLKQTDLMRVFLHHVFRLWQNGKFYKPKNEMYDSYEKYEKNYNDCKKNDIRYKYLEKIKRTLQKAIEDEQKEQS